MEIERQLMSEPELRRAIKAVAIQNSEKKAFIPESSLYALLSVNQIKKVLSAYIPEHNVTETTDVVYSYGRKILAILIDIEHVTGIISFINNDIADDNRLPLTKDVTESVLRSQEDAFQFFLQQWKFISPTFGRRTLWRHLPGETILPIIRETYLGSGGFGDIFEICFEPSYQSFGGSTQIVRKQFKRSTSFESYAEELENLSKLKHMSHPNIIPLLGCYSYGDEHNLIFPLVSGGDLQKFLREPSPPHFRTLGGLLSSLVGLASALATVHDFLSPEFHLKSIGCHRDLRPANILANDSEFILTDFGLSRLRQIPETSESLYRVGRGPYIAPECQSLDGDFQKYLVSRPSDIWSFGCIMLELWTHHCKAPQGVQEFFEDRGFSIGCITYHLFHCGATASAAVLDWIERLESEADNSTGDIPVLLSQLIRKMLNMDPKKRPTAPEVVDELEYLALLAAALSTPPLFQELFDHNDFRDFPLELEYRRFYSWLDVLPRTHSMCEDSGLILRDTINDLAQFRRVLSCLHEIQVEIGSIRERQISSDTGSHDRMYFSLRHLITTLFRSLPQAKQSIARNTLEHNLLLRSDTDLRKIREVLQTHEELRSADSHLLFLADMKLSTVAESHRLQYSEHEGTHEMSSWPRMDAEKAGGHITGYCEGVDPEGSRLQVIIEKKRYADHVARERTRLKLNAICNLLSSDRTCRKLRVLKCRGFYHDQKSFLFGLVFEFPGPACPNSNNKSAFTLASILKKRHRPDKPTLRGRYQMAAQLAASLSDLHCMNWFHKNLSSSNILFFNPTQASTKDLSDPFIVGLAFSRPDEMVLFSEGPPQSGSSYQSPQHPDYRSGLSFYSREYDYYGLGLILMEIGLWVHMDDITENCLGDKYDFIFEKKVPLLAASMGSRFQSVVKQCLGGDFSRDKRASRNSVEKDYPKSVEVLACFKELVDTLSSLASFDI